MRTFLINQAKTLADQTRRQPHTSRRLLSLLPSSSPLLTLSRFLYSTLEMSASDSTSSLLVSINPKVCSQLDSSGYCFKIVCFFFGRLCNCLCFRLKFSIFNVDFVSFHLISPFNFVTSWVTFNHCRFCTDCFSLHVLYLVKSWT